MKILKKGAEADVFLAKTGVVKIRPVKSYRLPQIDAKLRSSRTRAEANNLLKAKKAGVNVPSVIKQDVSKSTLELEKITGTVMKDALSPKNYAYLAKKIGEQIARLHAADLVHGDLTTSNMILSSDGSVYLIDFGLSSTSLKAEDKAVDLHLLEETFESTHSSFGRKTFSLVVKAYLKKYKKGKEVLDRLDALRKRGRYKND